MHSDQEEDGDFFFDMQCFETPQKGSDTLGAAQPVSSFPTPSSARVLLIEDLDSKARDILTALDERLKQLPQVASDMLRHLRQQPNCPDSVIISLLEEDIKSIEAKETRVLNQAEILQVLDGLGGAPEPADLAFFPVDF